MNLVKRHNKTMDPRVQVVEVKCPRCGKILVPAPYHVYRDHKGYYCSWSCYNHRLDKEEPKHEEDILK